MQLYLSSKTDPRVNMGLEHFFLNEWGGEGCLVYRNAPSVIIGKNQNPYREVNTPFCKQKGISIFRRISGGGTVYHDQGNINTAFFGKRGSICDNLYERWAEPFLKFLRVLGLNVQPDGRNGVGISGKKISGFAQCMKAQRFLCHATLLYQSDLAALNRSLEPLNLVVEAQGIVSQPSEVANVSEFLSKQDSVETFQQKWLAFLLGFLNCEKISPVPQRSASFIRHFVENQVDRWEWNIGRSPRFKASIKGANGNGNLMLVVYRGRIESVNWEQYEPDPSGDISPLIGQPFRLISLPNIPGLNRLELEKILI